MNKTLTAGLSVVMLAHLHAQDSATAARTLNANSTIRVPAFDLPPSSLLTPEARDAVAHWMTRVEATTKETCPYGRDGVQIYRKCMEEHFYAPLTANHRARYHVAIQPQVIAGVYTEVITPVDGLAPENHDRVLINLHGGAFILGARSGGQIESIPIAAVGRIKVVSVDYRMAPEHEFPAASEDVAAIYRELLKWYRPENIGIYGCSAGGLLTAEAVSWFRKEGLPSPGAVGVLCAGAGRLDEGDSHYIGMALRGSPGGRQGGPGPYPSYFRNTAPTDPLAFPINAPEVLAKFPPTLLVTATRDFVLSAAVHTHAELVRHGVEAELHVWEGLDHAFFFDPDIPQSREVYDVTVKFFNKHLGKH